MTNFEIFVTLVLIWYGIIFGIVCAELFSRTRRNKSGIEITNKILNSHDSRIDRVVDRMDFLVQMIGDSLEELKKEDTSTNSKAGYGHVFNLKIASIPDNPMFNDQIAVYTVDDLKAIWDKYGHHSKNKIFDTNRLIINFDENCIIIYDTWVE